ncbi:MAG TPA: EamA family transporter, partial [Ilumatobacteraceae bacterium]
MGLVLAGLGVLAFSFSIPLTKIAVRGLDPVVAAVGRAAVASVFAMIVIAVAKPKRPTRKQVVRLAAVVAGVIFGFPILIAYALRHTASLHGSVVNGLLPLATAGLAVLRAGERPSSAYWA